ncbi:SpoIID/LytB domain-containing protein [Trichocoleus sp. DQ-A2]|uniref:SpoIID/LytB domain-containing protein n=2 Tax=Cyanophyceae TaxID=3028117 RepID=UPI001F554047|nr:MULTISPECIES: SpoIID/LytB domain-containing protein [unclassified Coleofasciculus]
MVTKQLLGKQKSFMLQTSCFILGFGKASSGRLHPSKWWLTFLLWLMLVAPAKAMELRVAIQEGVSKITVGSSTKAVIRDSAGRVVGQMAAMDGMEARPTGGGVALGGEQSTQLIVEPTAGGYVWIGDRWYRGRTRLVRTGKGLTAVNQVDLEQYLYSVLGSEMSANWPLEALKAQAVAARSYALYKRQTAGNSVFDVGDTQTWQVYKGLETEAESTQMAVNATAGQVLTYNGQIILAVFHSASGGHTENVENVWSEPLAYLRGVPDYDQGTPGYQWQKSFSRNELSRLLGVSNVKSLIPERTTPSGRIMTMKVVGSGSTRRMTGSQLRQALKLRSTLFTVSSTGTGFQLNGRGFGHGLGLSQWGAYNLAQQGTNYQQILGHYYQRTAIASMKVQ